MKNISTTGYISIAIVVFILAIAFVFITSQIRESSQKNVYQEQLNMKQAPLDDCLNKVQEMIDANQKFMSQIFRQAHDPKQPLFYNCGAYSPSHPNPGGNDCPTLDELSAVLEKFEREIQPDKDECYRKYK